MENRNLRQHLVSMRQSFFDEGILDGQFTVLEQLQDRDNPDFIEEAFNIYFSDSIPLLTTFEQEMNTVPTDFSKMDRILYRLKGSSASIGANRVRNQINRTREFLQQENLEGARVAFQDLQNEHGILNNKLRRYFRYLRYADPARTASPPR